MGVVELKQQNSNKVVFKVRFDNGSIADPADKGNRMDFKIIPADVTKGLFPGGRLLRRRGAGREVLQAG